MKLLLLHTKQKYIGVSIAKKDFHSPSFFSIFPGLLIAFNMAKHLPWGYFDFEWHYPLFLYLIIFEFCFFMLYLWGGTGYWILQVLTVAAKTLSIDRNINYNYVNKASLEFFSGIILKLCMLMFIVMISVAPSVWIINMWFRPFPTVYYSITVGLTALAIFLLFYYFSPNYFLHRMLLKAKKNSLYDINRQRAQIKVKLEKSSINSVQNAQVHILNETFGFLNERYIYAAKQPVWAFSYTSIIELTTGFAITLLSIFSELAVKLF